MSIILSTSALSTPVIQFFRKIFQNFPKPLFFMGIFHDTICRDSKKPRAQEKIMREIGLIAATCVIGWTLATGVGSVQEIRHWAKIDASAQKQAELSWSGLPAGELIGIQMSPATR
jgi:hypothetical protein